MASSKLLMMEREVIQVNDVLRKPWILLAASGTVVAIKFGNLCHSFDEWEKVRTVAKRASLHFIDRASPPKDVILYTDEDEWTSWNKIGGLCDNLLTCIVQACEYNKPVFVAPAMNRTFFDLLNCKAIR
ncbi:hypothetical protein UlMin_004587 [Ulmus minor]